MKSLNEEIQDIKTGKGSKTSKKEALIKLGLRKHEIDIILSDLPKQVAERFKFTFGVEIECLVASSVMRECATRNAMPFQYEGYNHEDNNHYYKFVSDSSIRGENPIECVSPVLTGKAGMKSLENFCKALNEANAQVNVSTGLHVHIGAQNLSDEANAILRSLGIIVDKMDYNEELGFYTDNGDCFALPTESYEAAERLYNQLSGK